MSLSVRVPRRLETSILFDKLEPPWYPVSRLVFTEGAFLRLCQGVPHLATYPLFFTKHTSLPSGKGEDRQNSLPHLRLFVLGGRLLPTS